MAPRTTGAEKWIPLPLDQPLFANLDPDAVVGHQVAIENGFINDLRGHTRFPGLIERVDLGGKARVYLHDFNGDLIAARSDGQVFRIDRAYNPTNVTSVPVGGGRRVIFAKSDRDLMMAAGGPIVRLRNRVTELLSPNAPIATHIGWVDNFTIAVEMDSGRFFNSKAGEPDQWDPLDSFAADGYPENIASLIVTPFRELIMGGEHHIEQFERQITGDVPFFRRWSIGDGIKLPYAILFTDNAVWTVNFLNMLVRFSGQAPMSVSDAIGKLLEDVDDWTDAWIGGYPDRPLHIVGQQFILLQIPKATNPYGTKGITLLYDYRNKRFCSLYGWDDSLSLPTRWPGWSHWRLWDKTFVGGEGKIYELTEATHSHAGGVQRWLVRTAHIAEGHQWMVKNFRLQVKRGGGGNTTASTIRVRCSRDGKPMGVWINKTLGMAGDTLQFLEFGSFGVASTFQWEIASTDDCPINLIKAEVKVDPVGH